MAKTVLITDDRAFMRMVLKNAIQKGGYEVIGEATDGEDAIAKYKSLRPDLVTMDLTMPRMDGITAIKEIIKIDRNAKIVVCSQKDQRQNVVEALSAGASDFLVKPFDSERLAEAFKRVLE